MYQMEEEDARKILDWLRRTKYSIEEGIATFERLVVQNFVDDSDEKDKIDPDDYLSEWVTWENDDYLVEYEDLSDDELYETDTFFCENNSLYEDQNREYYDCAFCEECDANEL